MISNTYQNSVLAPSFLPASVVFEMTYLCNHKCLFCSCPWEAPNSNFIKHNELSIDEWKLIAEKVVNMGVTTIAFSGGEPLMKKNLDQLIQFVANLKARHIETENNLLVERILPPKMYLISNGSLMSNEVLDLCKTYNIQFSMSLPGLSTYTYHTQFGSPQNILKWFEISKQKGVNSTVNISVTRKNLPELFETISSALIAGADTLLLNRFLPGGRGLKYQNELILDIDGINQMLEIAEDVLQRANRYGSVGTELPKCIIKKHDFKHLTIGTRCSAAIDFFVIDPSGYIRACNHAPVRLNHVNDIEKVKFSDYWKKFVFKQYHPEMCQNCELEYDCDGGCREAAHIIGGQINSKDPVFI